ncbi:MAG: hypothetical protein ACM3SQ_04225 [Betaproteobacteria bacterium]
MPHLMRVVVRPHSPAERKHHLRARQARPAPTVRVAGLPATPEHDLKFRGGRTIAHLSYVNVYVGGSAAWSRTDVDAIDGALDHAMADHRLNNVMRQYFANEPIATTFVSSQFTGSRRPKVVTQTSTEKLVTDLFRSGHLANLEFDSSVVNLLLPSGTVLTDGTGTGREDDRQGAAASRRKPGKPETEEVSSLEGLGGYHGSVDIGRTRVYYAVGVYSERLANGKENGIAVFDEPWKNVVATFYHELNEARTDPDVEEAIRTNRVEGIIGWNSDDGEECGDFPVFEAGDAGNLDLVFREVSVAGGEAPVQFQYSNAVHGPEGPISSPHRPASTHEMA